METSDSESVHNLHWSPEICPSSSTPIDLRKKCASMADKVVWTSTAENEETDKGERIEPAENSSVVEWSDAEAGMMEESFEDSTIVDWTPEGASHTSTVVWSDSEVKPLPLGLQRTPSAPSGMVHGAFSVPQSCSTIATNPQKILFSSTLECEPESTSQSKGAY